jgi:catechol 2,3-dioxygenase
MEEIMSNHSIHPNTTIGHVHLTVADLDRSLDFYQQIIGLQLRHRQGQTAYLGTGGPDLLLLTEQPGARQVSGVTGLYHLAILVPSRLALAQSLRRIAETRTPVQGFADHWVSEAIYLPDPDGNGIEIYRDRPRAEWPRQNGQLQMATDPLDVSGVLAELGSQSLPWTGLERETVIGHVHLHVATIPAAEAFYVDTLGFDLVLRYGPSASFVSAGGYHHHLGLNTWAGVNAPPPPADAAGLRYYTINLPDVAALAAVLESIERAGVDFQEKDGIIFLRDPAQNGVVLSVGVGAERIAELALSS